MLNLQNYKHSNIPFDHIIVEDAVSIKQADFLEQLQKIEPSQFIKSSNSNFQKQELRVSNGLIGDLLGYMQSNQMLRFCEEQLNIEKLYPDPSYDGGGLTITPTGGFLRYHADFPYSNSTNQYRVVNAILYLSTSDIKGGNLHLIDYESGTVEKSIAPQFGKIAIFPTSKYTQHGVSRILDGTRIGINAYYYADNPLDDRLTPSKTLWINNNL